jgi:signal transduction histidine kinase
VIDGAPRSLWLAVLGATAGSAALAHMAGARGVVALLFAGAGTALAGDVVRRWLRGVFAEAEARSRLGELEGQRREERTHDARSAATAIHGAALAIAEGGEDVDPHIRRRMARALVSEARRLLRLIDSAEPDPPPATLFPVAATVGAVVACRTSPAFEVSVDVPDGLMALGDPDDTAEVLANLLDNARRHAAGSAVLVRAAMELGNVVVRVEDRGPGVHPSEWGVIFERGRRGSTAAGDGQGLGLSVSRRLVRRHGGDLWVEGRPGGGASFVFYLPGFGVAQRSGAVWADYDGATA